MFSLFRGAAKTPTLPQQNKQDFYKPEKETLPEGFAQNMLDLEMRLQFDQTFNLDTIQALNEMYRIGIEYYINVDPKKMQHFQRKLANLLTHPRTLSIIENKDKQRAKSMNPRPVTTEVNNRLKEEVSKFNSQANTVIKNIIQSNQQKLATNENIIRNGLKKQQAEVRNRIVQRSKSRRKNN